MAEWMRYGPKDVIEIDDECDDMSERELYRHIQCQMDFCKSVFTNLANSYKRLVKLERMRREARSREIKKTWEEQRRRQAKMQEEENTEVKSRMCFACGQMFDNAKKKRERSRSRSRSRDVTVCVSIQG